MENMMRRAISAFMALVLVLGMMPGIPMFAGAEEVETQPETVVVETTEAVTVPGETEAPETTAAPETEPEETIPETTAAVETVPETTEAQETVPEETVAEEETVPQETVPEETVPEVTEEPADANDTIVLAKKIEISASKERTYVGDDVKLTATFTPSDTTETEVSWVVEGGEYILKDGILRASEAGIFTVYAEATDGSGIISDPVEIEFVNYKMEINETPGIFPEENVYEGEYVLQTGDTLDISVAYLTWTDSESDAKAEIPLHTPDLEWTLVGDSDKYAELTYKDAAKKEVSLKAKLVTEYKYVTLHVRDNAIGWEDSITIRLYPDSYKVYVTETVNEHGESVEKDVTNGVIALDVAKLPADEEVRITLEAGIWPEEGNEKLVWSTSNSLVELEDPDEEDDWNNEMVLLVSKLSGDTTVTVQGAEHPGVFATITIKRVRYVQEIFPTKASEEVQYDGLVEGKSVTLQAAAYEDREIVDNKLLKWELAEGDEEYATISDMGVLKAKNVDMGRVITVKCTVLREDDQEPAGFELYIPIIPKATAVNIYSDTFVSEGAARTVMPGQVINGMTITVDTTEYQKAVPVFEVLPCAEEDYYPGALVGVKQEVTWKSSNTSVAAFDPLTDELVWKGKNGTTTITATATDGSGKSASVKLQFGAKLRELYIVDEEGIFLRSGKNWTFELGYYPENATNKSVTWAVYARDAYGDFTADASSIATISSNGKLTAKTVYDNHMVRVVATSKEDSRIQASYDVLIRPKTDDFLTLLDDEGNCVTKSTIQVDLGQPVVLTAAIVGEEEGDYEDVVATWTSSNKAIEVDDGFVTTGEKTGNATITAKFDGKTATVTIKVVSQVDDIYVYEKKNPENYEGVLSTGKSLELKADVCDWDTATEKLPNGKPTVSKVTWHIAGEGSKYATVNSSGKVTANKNINVNELPVCVEVYARATDGSGVESMPYSIWIYPAAETVRIRIEGKAYDTYTYFMGSVIDEDFDGEEAVQLTAVVSPWDDSWGDAPVTWKSSNAKIATVAPDGTVVAYKPGTVTITATAADGSGKKATLKLVITSTIARLEWNNDANELVPDQFFAIAGGKNLTLKPVFYGVDGKKLNIPVEWEISKIYDDYGTAFVKKFSKGAITTEKVTSPKFTEITLKFDEKYALYGDYVILDGASVDGGYAYVTVTVGVYPPTTSLNILYNGSVTNKIWKKAGCDDFYLGVEVNEGAAYGWTWKSSNEKIATVDENGVVSCTWDEKTESYKAGTVTITATAKDGSGKKDTITIVFEK